MQIPQNYFVNATEVADACALGRVNEEQVPHPVHVIILPPVLATFIQLLPHMQPPLFACAGDGVVKEQRHY